MTTRPDLTSEHLTELHHAADAVRVWIRTGRTYPDATVVALGYLAAEVRRLGQTPAHSAGRLLAIEAGLAQGLEDILARGYARSSKE